jgi:hypothetical protein
VQDKFPLQRVHSSYDCFKLLYKRNDFIIDKNTFKALIFVSLKMNELKIHVSFNANPNLASTDWLSDIDSDIHPHTTKHGGLIFNPLIFFRFFKENFLVICPSK